MTMGCNPVTFVIFAVLAVLLLPVSLFCAAWWVIFSLFAPCIPGCGDILKLLWKGASLTKTCSKKAVGKHSYLNI